MTESRLLRPSTLFMIVVVFMVFKYWYDHRDLGPEPNQRTPDAVFAQLEDTMHRRLKAIPESVKRKLNQNANFGSSGTEYSPHQAGYQVLMHVKELFTGNAVASISKDCSQWYEEFAVQLKPGKRQSNVMFDFHAKRVESLTNREAQVVTKTKTLVNNQMEESLKDLRFNRVGEFLELRSEGETIELAPDTMLNIESGIYVLNQIAQQNYQMIFYSEPDDFSKYPIRNEVVIEPFTEDYQLTNMWVIKTQEYKDEGNGYVLDTSVIELINPRAITLYAATVDADGVLYELILNDFEYLPARCKQFAAQ